MTISKGGGATCRADVCSFAEGPLATAAVLQHFLLTTNQIFHHIKRFTVIRSIAYAIPDTHSNSPAENNDLVKCSHLTKYLIKPMENQHFRVRMSGQHGPYHDASTKRPPGSGHMLLPRWRTHATQETRNGPLCLNGILSLGPRE